MRTIRLTMKLNDLVESVAFDMLIHAIDNASPDELRKAIKVCRDIAHDLSWRATERAIYRDMATLLRKHAKR